MRQFWEDQRRLAALQAIAEDDQITQRRLAGRLGVSLGLAHAILHELESKGWVSCRSRSRAKRHAVTAAGRGATARLALRVGIGAGALCGTLRKEMACKLGSLRKSSRVLLCGNGALADMAASAILNARLKLVAVVSEESRGFISGLPVQTVERAGKIACDMAVALRPADASALKPHLQKKTSRLVLLANAESRRA